MNPSTAFLANQFFSQFRTSSDLVTTPSPPPLQPADLASPAPPASSGSGSAALVEAEILDDDLADGAPDAAADSATDVDGASHPLADADASSPGKSKSGDVKKKASVVTPKDPKLQPAWWPTPDKFVSLTPGGPAASPLIAPSPIPTASMGRTPDDPAACITPTELCRRLRRTFEGHVGNTALSRLFVSYARCEELVATTHSDRPFGESLRTAVMRDVIPDSAKNKSKSKSKKATTSEESNWEILRSLTEKLLQLDEEGFKAKKTKVAARLRRLFGGKGKMIGFIGNPILEFFHHLAVFELLRQEVIIAAEEHDHDISTLEKLRKLLVGVKQTIAKLTPRSQFPDESNVLLVSFVYVFYEIRILEARILELQAEVQQADTSEVVLAKFRKIALEVLEDCKQEDSRNRAARERIKGRKGSRSSRRMSGQALQKSSAMSLASKYPEHALEMAQLRCLFHFPRMACKIGKVEEAMENLRQLMGNVLLKRACRLEAYRQYSGLLLENFAAGKSLPFFRGHLDRDRDDDSTFEGADPVEEALLALLLAESSLTDADPRSTLTGICNDVAVAICETCPGASTPLPEFIGRRVGRGFPNVSLWEKLGLSLLSRREYSKAVQVLKECTLLDPDNAKYPMLVARCYLLMSSTSDQNQKKSLKWTSRVLDGSPGFFTPTVLRYRAVALSRLAPITPRLEEKQRMQQTAIRLLKKSIRLDQTNWKALFNLALQYSFVRDIPSAFKYAKRCLHLNPDCLETWILITLLFTAWGKKDFAADTLEKASVRFPLRLELRLLLIALLKNRSVGVLDDVKKRLYSLMGLVSPVSANSRRFKEGLSFLFLLIDMYMEAGEFRTPGAILRELGDCPHIDELADFHYYLGMLAPWEEAVITDDELSRPKPEDYFHRALRIDPRHTRALLRLGVLHADRAEYPLATSYLQNATRVDPTLEEAWFELGKAFKAMDELPKASDCLFTAVKLERTSPMVPFDRMLRMMV